MAKGPIGQVPTPPTNAVNSQGDNDTVDSSLESPGAQIQAEEAFVIGFRYSHLKGAKFPCRNDKYIIIYVIDKNGYRNQICQTEEIHINSNPSWEPISVSMRKVGSEETPLVIKLFDSKSNGDDLIIGEIQTSVRQLEQLHQQGEAAILAPPDNSLNFVEFGERKLFVDKFTRKGQCSQ